MLKLFVKKGVVYKCFLRKVVYLRLTDVRSFRIHYKNVDVGYCRELSLVREIESGLAGAREGRKRESISPGK